MTFDTPLSDGDRELYMNHSAPNYFATMRIPMVMGRDFRWDDGVEWRADARSF